MRSARNVVRQLVLVCYATLPLIILGCSLSPSKSDIEVMTSKQNNNPTPHLEVAVKTNKGKLREDSIYETLSEIGKKVSLSEDQNKELVVVFLYDANNPIWEDAQGKFQNYQCTAMLTAKADLNRAGESILSSFKKSRLRDNEYFSFAGCGKYVDLTKVINKSIEISSKKGQPAHSDASKSNNKSPSKVVPLPTRHKTLHISYNDIMFVLDNLFPSMEYIQLADGTDRYFGTSVGEAAVLELIGDTKDLQQLYLMVTLPADSPETLLVNGLALNRFIQNAAPDWKGSVKWLSDSLERIYSTNRNQIKTTRGNMVFTMEMVDILNGVALNVTPK